MWLATGNDLKIIPTINYEFIDCKLAHLSWANFADVRHLTTHSTLFASAFDECPSVHVSASQNPGKLNVTATISF